MTFEEYLSVVSSSIESGDSFEDTPWDELREDGETWRMAIDCIAADIRDQRDKVSQEREAELDRIRTLEQSRENGIAFRKAKRKYDGQESRLIGRWDRLSIHRRRMQGCGPGDRVGMLHEFVAASLEGADIEDLVDLYDEYLSTFNERDWCNVFEEDGQ